MVHSDIKKIMIRHEMEEESAMQEFPVNPVTPLKSQRNIVSAWAYRDITGTMHQKNTASIPKIYLEFKGISLSDALLISKEMIDDKILEYGTKNFYLNVKTIQHGWINGLFTLGTPDTAELVVDLSNDMSAGVVDLAFEFQAVEGFKLSKKEG
jgi:hypothetical protein